MEQETENKVITVLFNTIKVNLFNIYKILCSTAIEYTCFSNTYGTFIKMNHIMDHKILYVSVNIRRFKPYRTYPATTELKKIYSLNFKIFRNQINTFK